MRTSLALLALAASAFATPRAASQNLSPEGSAPAGCDATYDGEFEVTIFSVKSAKAKRDTYEKRGTCSGDGVLVMNLKDGVLQDAKGRTGYIASNFQFQFDQPPQVDAKYTAGFSACNNQSLALGSTTQFYKCKSGDFYNLYDRNWAEQCEPAEIVIMPCGGGAPEAKDKRVVGSSIVATTVVTVVSDGTTKEVPTTIAVPMCQIGDGQVQIRTTPCDDMEMPIITAPPVSQVPGGAIKIPESPAVLTAPVAPESNPGELVLEDTKTLRTENVAAAAASDSLATDTGSAAAAPAQTAKAKASRTTSSEAQETTFSTATSESTDSSTDSSSETGSGSSEDAAVATQSVSSGMKLMPSAVFALIVGNVVALAWI